MSAKTLPNYEKYMSFHNDINDKPLNNYSLLISCQPFFRKILREVFSNKCKLCDFQINFTINCAKTELFDPGTL